MQVSRGLHEPYGRRALHTCAFHNLPQPPRPRKRLGPAYAVKIMRDGHLVGLRHGAIDRVPHDAHSPALLIKRVVCPAPHSIVSHNVSDEHSNHFYLPSEPRLNKLVCWDARIAIDQSITWDAVWKRANALGDRIGVEGETAKSNSAFEDRCSLRSPWDVAAHGKCFSKRKTHAALPISNWFTLQEVADFLPTER